MKIPKEGKDKLKNNLFTALYPINIEAGFQVFEEEIKKYSSVYIATLAMDFSSDVTKKRRKEIDNEWLEKLPTLKNIKSISIRHKVNKGYFEALCKMENLETLVFWSSSVEDISSIKKLKKLKSLRIGSFTQLEDISPLLDLKTLKILSIDNCFKIDNYELIGKMNWLEALSLEGDTFAPKNLIVPSLIPFSGMQNLKHLNLSTTSIKDKSFLEILKLKNLNRLDASWRMKNEIRQKILIEHKSLVSGFFVAYDFIKNEFKQGIEWWKESS